MSESISATHEYLLAHYGPLLTLKHLAEVMHSTPNGVRMAMARQRQPLATALANTRRQLGRRVYFEARLVAEVIDGGLTDTPAKEMSSAEKSHPSEIRPHNLASTILRHASECLQPHPISNIANSERGID